VEGGEAVICSDREALQIAEARCAELEARVRELEDMRRASLEIINEQRGRIVGTELRLAALTEAAHLAIYVLSLPGAASTAGSAAAKLRAALEEKSDASR
jgi:hypothetical protein